MLRIEGRNLAALATAQIPVYIANKNEPTQRADGTAQAVLEQDGSQYLRAVFNGLNLSPGFYYVVTNNSPVAIHGMIDEADYTDTSASVEVADYPAVTGVVPQPNNNLHQPGKLGIM